MGSPVVKGSLLVVEKRFLKNESILLIIYCKNKKSIPNNEMLL